MLKSKGKIQVGIYLISILMMGVVGIASAISVIGANFPELSQTDVQTLISIPCIIIIPVTLIVGKLMQVMSKKLLAIIGIILFLIGGLVPAFMTSFLALQILRGVFGVGVGILQVVSTALVAENFEGAERDRVQGNLQAFQMLGCAIMVFVGGWLATMGWNTVFYVHIIGAISLIVALVCLPNVKPSAPAKAANSAPAEKGKLTGKMWVWMIIAFFVFCTGQLYSNGNAYLLTEKGIGDSAASGLGMAFFCAGGIIMGLLYGKLASALGAEKLMLLTDIEGLCNDIKLRDVISYLNIADVQGLKDQGTIAGGMIPKVDCCVQAIEEGVTNVHIIDGRKPHSILYEAFTDEGIGTTVGKDAPSVGIKWK